MSSRWVRAALVRWRWWTQSTARLYYARAAKASKPVLQYKCNDHHKLRDPYTKRTCQAAQRILPPAREAKQVLDANYQSRLDRFMKDLGKEMKGKWADALQDVASEGEDAQTFN